MADGGSSAYIPANINSWHKGGGSGAAYIARVELDGTYDISIGSGGKCSNSNGHDGGDTSIVENGLGITVEGGKAGGSDEDRGILGLFDAGGTGGSNNITSNTNIKNVYLNNNGSDGIAKIGWGGDDGSFGGNSVMTSSTFKTGIGNNRGYGGSKKWDTETPAGGGCLYILPNSSYCVCTISAPEGTQINATVSEDSVNTDGNYIQNTNIQAGAISGTTKIQFIVKKGATITYSARKDYMIDNGSFTAGENVNSDNEQEVNLTLKKEIVEHTINCKGDFKITGEFTDDNGTIISREKTGKDSITFKVWKDPSHNSVTVSKTYYDSSTIQITDNGTTTVNLNKHKYFVDVNNVTYEHSQDWGEYKWRKTKNLTADDATYDSAYMYALSHVPYAKIKINTVTGVPSEWTMYLDGCYGDSVGNPTIKVSIGDNEKLNTAISKNKDNNYTINGKGTTVNNITIKFTINRGISVNFYLDSVYFVVND